jgi:hypothetical protein
MYDEIKFIHQDATDLSSFSTGSFGYATVLFWMHEIPRDLQTRVLCEALWIADRVVVADSKVPLPRNAYGLGIRVVEASFGREHYRSLQRYLSGGIMGVVGALEPPPVVEDRRQCWHGCREVVTISRARWPTGGNGNVVC